MKMLFLVAVLVALGGIVFADIGPGPDPIDVTVKVVENGAPHTGAVEMTYLCAVSEVRTTESALVDPYDMIMTCEAGECVRGTYYKLNPCFHSKGRFELKVGGKTLTSSEVSLETPGEYVFDMDVNTGALTASVDNPQPPGPTPTPSGWRSYGCCTSGALLALLIGGAYVRSRR